MPRTASSVLSLIQRIHVGALREADYVAPELFRRPDVAERQAKLADIVAAMVVPKLADLHRDIVGDGAIVFIDQSEIVALGRLLLSPEVEAAAAYVTMLRDRGLPMDVLFVKLLEPAARYLGEMWERDECDFVDVSLGLGRLQKLLAVFNCTHTIPALNRHRTVVLATMPQDPHFFGISMVAKFLRAGGWDTTEELGVPIETVANRVRERWFAVAGLTLGTDRHLDTMRTMIAAIRAASRNPAIGILVGGQIFTEDPSAAAAVGADATASNAPTAVLAAQKLFDIAARRGFEGGPDAVA
jgi:MerR family transcriptional regulator, light-induced transcriptional regulator